MCVSIVLATYDQPEWLEKVIWGYAVQSYWDFELIVADDGSREETADCLRHLKRETGLAIQHVWHEHRCL